MPKSVRWFSKTVIVCELVSSEQPAQGRIGCQAVPSK